MLTSRETLLNQLRLNRMIENQTIKIPVVDDLTSDYIEEYFKQNNLNVLRWAIVDRVDGYFVLNVSLIV